jgi:hypothetical protein
MTDFDELTLAKLARELVMNIRNYKLVFADYGIDENDYYEIEKNAFFKKIKDHYTVEWNSATSTEDRLRIESLAYLERVYPALARRALDPQESLAAATGFANLLARTAGVGQEKSGPANSSERFVITINLGADTETYNKSIEVDPNDVDPSKLGASHGKLDRKGANQDGAEGNGRQPAPRLGRPRGGEDPAG